ncbi:hypothetical protein L6164_026366 [Bauhinia variegata]|uniref:Uncharacterized protein n=1 Tax=Bauhinia variegata TaxID=167791 RepID=A0ACB9LQA7_BAUVA|nr:hypothetical protein L6164_026366 [Bauhinia variegata]
MADYGDFAPTEALADLIPPVDYSAPIEEWPLLLVKLTKFNCGGLCIGIAVSHIVGDGWTWLRFIRSWAKLARGENLQQDEIPLHDRRFVFTSIKESMSSNFDHREYQPPPVVLGLTTAVDEIKKESTAAIFRLTPEQVKKLQKKANEGLNQDRPFSRYEAIAGHIWKCACMARLQDDRNSHQPTVIRTVASIRNRLKPFIPLNYAGNAILTTLTTTCFFKDLLSNPLSYAAKKIREAIESMTDEYCWSIMDWLSQNEIGSEEVEFFYGNPNFNIGSWTTLPVYDADFGWGNPVYMGPAKLSCGKAIIMPSPSNDGSLLIALRFETRHFQDFEDFLYQSI